MKSITGNGSDTISWTIKRFDELTLRELYEILKLRSEIFVVEQDCVYQDMDDKDYSAWHLFLKQNDIIVAYLRILPEGVSYDETAIGRVVVKSDFRKRGISKKMMRMAMDFIEKDLLKDAIRLSGQAHLCRFYENLGFRKVSDVYLEDGINHFEFLYEVKK